MDEPRVAIAVMDLAIMLGLECSQRSEQNAYNGECYEEHNTMVLTGGKGQRLSPTTSSRPKPVCGRDQNVAAYVRGRCINSGGTVRRSIVEPCCKINSFSLVENSLLVENVEIGENVRIKKTIIGENVKTPMGCRQ